MQDSTTASSISQNTEVSTQMAVSKPVVTVEVVADLICPWCWIGKRKLEKAVACLSDRFQFQVRWSPFLLKPDVPPGGVAIQDDEEYSHVKKRAELKRAKRAGDEVGLDLTFSSPVVPCSVQSHALVQLAGMLDSTAGHPSLQSRIVENVFEAYLRQGKSLVESDLLAIAADAGLDTEETRQHITDDKKLCDIRAIALDWPKRGVTGVPCFYINGQRMFSGAQDVEMFKRMICMAVQRSTKLNSSAADGDKTSTAFAPV